MITTIGLMVGSYIFTRMVELLSQDKTGLVTRLFAAATLLFNLVCIYLLLISTLIPDATMAEHLQKLM